MILCTLFIEHQLARDRGVKKVYTYIYYIFLSCYVIPNRGSFCFYALPEPSSVSEPLPAEVMCRLWGRPAIFRRLKASPSSSRGDPKANISCSPWLLECPLSLWPDWRGSMLRSWPLLFLPRCIKGDGNNGSSSCCCSIGGGAAGVGWDRLAFDMVPDGPERWEMLTDDLVMDISSCVPE